ncbi:NMD3 family-domain-containing protein [Limtongia smithiae]|uniref:NMD3 family-domain-containing protein n=1 Tax=Limtongia smithiae TaxID=1125753 RepID=UPI0034CE9BC2
MSYQSVFGATATAAINGGAVPLSSYNDGKAIQTMATVLCCNCGAPIDGTLGISMCYDCVKLSVDITEGIQRESTVNFCRNCERFLRPPSQWVAAQLESRELLALCLKRLRGLTKVRLIDAAFIWTEPHSRRIKVKLTVQGEAFANTIIQQSFEVEYIVVATQCPDCAKSFTANTWRATVQIRQKVPHKRTFFYLEQLILKHNAHRDTISIQETRDGLDFFYSQKNHALKMVDFLSAVSPIKMKKSEELISMDTHTATRSYKFTFSIELVPICKDDLVCLPKKIARAAGNIAQVTLCTRVGNAVHLLDPETLDSMDLQPATYWRQPFTTLATSTTLTEFVVLDIELTGVERGKYALAEVTVARSSDMGRNDNTYFVRTHLGGILHTGDTVLGYFLSNANFNHELWDTLNQNNVPDVVLVKKSYPNRKKSKGRNWKLRRMAKEYNEMEDSGNSMSAKQRQIEQDRVERDYELFLQELEEDPELRGTINLYKQPNSQVAGRQRQPQAARMEGIEGGGEDEVSEVDGVGDAMETDDNDGHAAESEFDEEDDDEDSLPEVGLDELLDEIDELTLEDAYVDE